MTFPQPRDRHDPAFQGLVDEIYGFMTGQDSRAPSHVWTVAATGEGLPGGHTRCPQRLSVGWPACSRSWRREAGARTSRRSRTTLTFEVDDLLPLVDAAQLLGLAVVEDADLQITDDGKVFVAADILESKQIFARRAREHVPLVPRHLPGPHHDE